MSQGAPTILWAQRKDKLYLTFDVQDCKEPQIHISNSEDKQHGKVHFKGTGRSHATGTESHNYDVELDLFKPVDADDSKIRVGDHNILLVISKPQDAQGHWPRLLKSTDKTKTVKTDWDKWVDEDEEDEMGDKDLSDLQGLSQFQNFDLSSLGKGAGAGAGGAGLGAGLGDEEDSDDEDLPELEK